MTRLEAKLRHALLIATTALCLIGSAQAQVDPDLRVGVSELCTVCNDVVRCERSEAATDGPPLVIYNLLEDTFWQQIATIWDYLVQFISPKTDDLRAMTIYELDDRNSLQARVITEQEATVDAATLTIRLPADTQIDQRDGRWWRTGADGSEIELGQCELLDFSDGRDLLASLKPAT